jgi:hypothetical protein
MFERFSRLGLSLQVGADVRHEPCEVVQSFDVVWVWKEAYVEDQVGVERYAIFVPEGDDRNLDTPLVRALRKRRGDASRELAQGEARRIPDLGCALAERSELGSLGLDRGDEAALIRVRVPASGLAITPDEHVVPRIEEEDLRLVSVAQDRLDRVERIAEGSPAADVKGDRKPIAVRRARKVKLAAQKDRWEVVQAVEADVFEGFHGLALACPG